jgi:hypothetical protein
MARLHAAPAPAATRRWSLIGGAPGLSGGPPRPDDRPSRIVWMRHGRSGSRPATGDRAQSGLALFSGEDDRQFTARLRHLSGLWTAFKGVPSVPLSGLCDALLQPHGRGGAIPAAGD